MTIIGSNVPVFDIELFIGKTKPSCACDKSNEKIDSKRGGVFVFVNKIKKKFRVRLISADAPERGFKVARDILITPMHGCIKCEQVCQTVGKRRIYSTEAGNLRTDESFALRRDHAHHAI